ncbi:MULTISPECIES: flagellar basal body rod protein FlgB [Bacillaceae]|uniref:flagellar basal body rod protein FlgB n=1 Tax=Bacillaceae TaxID=186817 RepID=UPI001BDE3947|nr:MULTISPECIES: flagellar basal body rod protein FlgB [Bacillaceae]MDX8362259.1 flagellar basal body rod protein FlgB [Cytobacillus sp. IB215316]
MKLFSNTVNALESGLNYSSLKEKAISTNIANVDTPYYKAKSVSFKLNLENAMEEFQGNATNARHFNISSSSGQHPMSVSSRGDLIFNHNENNVDIDKEMTLLAENQIYFYALSDLINGKFASLKSVIKGGR